MANTREPILHPIPILSLHPTQMTVGMREVKEKRKRWRQHKSKKKQAELLGKHMIPVVLGPDQRHYVVDHHHLARSLHEEGVKDILVTVIADLTMVDPDAFWGVLDNHRWAYPYDTKGERRQRIRHRSANSCGRISCAAEFHTRAWKPISKRRSRKRWRWRKARTRYICRAGADLHRTISLAAYPPAQSRRGILAPDRPCRRARDGASARDGGRRSEART